MSHEQVDQEILVALQKSDQTHLLADWDNLTPDQRTALTSDIQVYTCCRAYASCKSYYFAASRA